MGPAASRVVLFILFSALAFNTCVAQIKKVETKPASMNDSDSVEKSRKIFNDEHRLFTELFTNYNRFVRPNHGKEITRVFFELSLFNLLSVDTKEQSVMTNSEIIMKWNDRFLSWNPDKYDGVTTIRVPYEKIWYPDIILQNTASAGYQDGILNTNAIIKYTGEVELTSHAVLDSICLMDIQWYPFDQQTCVLAFASWTYDTYKIRLTPGPADLSEYKENPEFFLEDFYRTLHDLHNPCCLHPVSTIKYHLQIQRRTIFSLFFFIMPGILINICALMVFSLPSESGEKVGLGINSMLAMMVFLMAMTEKLPPTAKLPLAGVYYGACITMITLNICFTVAVLNLNVMGMRGYHVPHFIRVVTLLVARTIMVKIPKVVKTAWELDENNRIATPVESIEKNVVKGSKIKVFNVKPATPPKMKPPAEVTMMSDLDDSLSVADIKDPFQRRTVLALESINRILSREARETADTGKKQNLVDEWKFVSRVMDRTLFITFSTAAIIFNLSILTSSPFRERFSYCPIDNCEELTMEEIMDLTANAASKQHFGGDATHGGTDDSVSSGHLHRGRVGLVALQEESIPATEGHEPHQENEQHESLQRGYREPSEARDEQIYVANPGPEYEGYEGLGLLPSPPQAQPTPRGTATRDGGRRG